MQLSALAAEQGFYNLRRECEEKDEIIKELTASAHASGVASSKVPPLSLHLLLLFLVIVI